MFCLNILRELQQNGFIMSIGLCNFDSIRTDEICTSLGPGIITTNQVQVSPRNLERWPVLILEPFFHSFPSLTYAHFTQWQAYVKNMI